MCYPALLCLGPFFHSFYSSSTTQLLRYVPAICTAN